MVINKYLAELLGTYVWVGVGSMAILASLASESGAFTVAVAFGFGLALLAAIYGFGHVSGGHFNPAVTLAAWLDKRTSTTDMIGYWIGQVVGGLLASLTVLAVAQQEGVQSTYTNLGPGVEDWEGFLVEGVLTAIFVIVILMSTKKAASAAPIAISLTLVAVHLAGIPFTGASVNPARSLAPAVVGAYGPNLWVYLLAPPVGAAVGWVIYRLFREDGEAAT